MGSRKWAAALSLLSIGLLAACGTNTENGKSGSSGKEPQPLADPTTQPANLVIFDTTGEKVELLMDKYGTKLKEKFPKFNFEIVQKVDSKTLPNLITGGTPIDIVVESTGVSVLEYGLQDDISDLIAKYKFDLNRLEPTTVEIQRKLAGGGLYGLPTWTRSMALYYNKDLFDMFGVSYPKDGMTWDELYELTRKMTRSEGGRQYKGLTMAFEFGLMLNQLEAPSQDAASGKALFLQDGFKKAFENQARFYQIAGNGLPGNRFYLDNQQNPFYKDKTAAMFLTLTGAEKIYKDSVNWDIASFPVFPGKEGIGSQSYPTYFFLSKTSKNREAAFQVLNYMTSDEFQNYSARSGNITILKDTSVMKQFAVDLPYVKGKNMKAVLPAKYAVPTLKTKHNGIANKELLAALEAVSKGADYVTALREASERNDKEVGSLSGK
ncbi:extracellular solute-binding protein [Paenibacillus mesophilus]|uniref:ABC transporter substrate-binding protein n=1 Tax=Paenibacillus mesophilus TaxID=2582849 RepID=UPI00110E9FC3|nr:extracellular solute-binding protein [Paenibacillus mesophilus]TMV47205.1 extracellular solute-binding protein [Paenibacillus mesophilus]